MYLSNVLGIYGLVAEIKIYCHYCQYPNELDISDRREFKESP